MSVDPVTLQILANHAQAAAESMAFTLFRTAHSTFVKETEDFTTGLTTPDGQTFASPRELGATWFVGLDYGPVIRAIKDYREGDVCMTNDPYSGFVCTHSPDIHLWKPVFWDGELMCFAVGHIHNTDVGGAVPASLSRALTEVHQEPVFANAPHQCLRVRIEREVEQGRKRERRQGTEVLRTAISHRIERPPTHPDQQDTGYPAVVRNKRLPAEPEKYRKETTRCQPIHATVWEHVGSQCPATVAAKIRIRPVADVRAEMYQQRAKDQQHAGGQQPDNQRPKDIKLFLYGHRPKVIETKNMTVIQPVALKSHGDIGYKPKKPAERIPAMQPFGCMLDEQHRQPHHHHTEIIKRKNPQYPPPVKPRPVAFRPFPRVHQDASDQKAGQHEEQIHPEPAALRKVEGRLVLKQFAEQKMADHYHGNGKSANTVERGEMAAKSIIGAFSVRRIEHGAKVGV